MPSSTTTLTISYKVDAALPMSAEEFITAYLTDIPLRGLAGGRLTDEQIELKIKTEAVRIENSLSIKIPQQKLSEYSDFNRSLFQAWGYIKFNFLINTITALEGRLNFAQQIVYPTSWISYDRSLENKRNMYIIAGQQAEEDVGSPSNSSFIAIFNGRFPIFGTADTNNIPNYWWVNYTTGFESVPLDILDAIGKKAAIQVLNIMGDINFGAGIASKSLSIDGLSQSINTTQSAENALYSARIRMYQGDLKVEMLELRNRYLGLSVMAL